MRRELYIALVATLLFGSVCYAQERSYTLAVRGVPLDEALERFVDATGEALSYEPSLVRGRTTSCAARDEAAEQILRCILRETGIDFHRLSSGTYVLTETAEIAPEHGYLAGRVVDRETGSPLSGAHVLLADAGFGAVTDQAGRFTFPSLLPGNYVLSVQHLGYRAWRDSLRVRSREQVQAEAKLSSEPILITPVIIDGFSDQKSFDALERPGVGALDPPAGHAGSSANVYRRVHAVPGVRLSDVTADAYLQGSDPGAHELRIDGAPVFMPYNLAGFIGPFSAFALDKITVHRAGFGAAEGSHLGGVFAAEHALSSANDLDLQVDPYSFNARLRLSSTNRISAMIAGRVGLSDLLPPARLESMLENWSRPDPFVLIAPLEGPNSTVPVSDPSGLLRRPMNPTVSYSDIHAAGRLRFDPLRSLHASFYQGAQRLEGGILSDRGLDPQVNDGLGLAVVDSYDWTNRAGQVRYNAVLGSRTLASVQARVSRYKLRHEYEALDSLAAVLQDSTIRISNIATSRVRDGNRVTAAALEAVVDHAFEGHQLQIGVETGLLQSRFNLQSVHFSAADRAEEAFGTAIVRDGMAFVDADQDGVSNLSDGWYSAVFAEERMRFGERLHIEGGVRLTYLNARKTVYAEPRASLFYGGSRGSVGWSARTSMGLYRQFLNQTDASQLSTGMLLPSIRIWLPVDASVRPPMAYHLAQEFQVTPLERWSLRFDAYLKFEPHGLTLAYAPAYSSAIRSGYVRQRDFLAGTRGTTYGGSASSTWRGSDFRAEVTYSYEMATRESPVLFGGSSHPVPWNEPHRLELSADWMPTSRITLSSRWKGVWDRSWGFRQLYYDYFGHSPHTRHYPPFDLGDPASHVLPPLYQLDLSAAYTRTFGSADVQLRAEVLNVLNRDNVIDWRLVRRDAEWEREAVNLYPMMPSLAARVTF